MTIVTETVSEALRPIRILHIDDDPGIGRLTSKRLRKKGLDVISVSDSEIGLDKLLQEYWDVLIIDHAMPGLTGLDVIARLNIEEKLPPTIMLTGAGDERVAVDALKLGASDYLVKDIDGRFIDLLPMAIDSVLYTQQLKRDKEDAERRLTQTLAELETRVAQRTEELTRANTLLHREIRDRESAQIALQASEAKLSAIFDTARDCVFIKDRDARITMVNPAYASLMGRSREEIEGKTVAEVMGSKRAAILSKTDARVFKGETVEEQQVIKLQDQELIFLTIKTPLRDDSGKITGLCGIARNITDRTPAALPSTTEDKVYASEAMRQCMMIAAAAANSDGVLLLTGESGVGKDYFARYIHNNSSRAKAPFYVINCAALPEELAESELFGHEQGAFTGAQRRKRGLLELAEGGTLFLNEIGELTPRLQAKLLMFLETKTFARVGGGRPINVDARLITATNRDLAKLSAEGSFRLDLYYRLNVLPLEIPPLRERRDDISMLVERLLSKLVAELNLPKAPRITAGALNKLVNYSWPGNIRELRNVLERAIILSGGGDLDFQHLDGTAIPDTCHIGEDPLNYDAVVKSTKIALITNALEKVGGKKQEAAQLLGITRDALKRQMKTLGF